MAAGKLPPGRVEHVCASVTDWAPGPVYDCGLCVLVLLHLPAPQRARAYESIRAALRDGGLFYIEDYLDNGLTEEDRARLALDLVGDDDELEAAMRHVFGNNARIANHYGKN